MISPGLQLFEKENIGAHEAVVLIFCDDQETKRVCEVYFDQIQYQSLAADNRKQALELLSSSQIDLIFLDIESIGDEGYTIIADLKNDFSQIPIIVFSLNNHIAQLSNYLKIGADDYIMGPLCMDLVKLRIEAILKRQSVFITNHLLREIGSLQQELELAIDIMPDGFAVFNRHNRLIMYNARLAEFYPHLHNYQHNLPANKRLKDLEFVELLQMNFKEAVAGKKLNKLSSQFLDHYIIEKLSQFSQPNGSWVDDLFEGKTIMVTTHRTSYGGTVMLLKDISQTQANQQHLAFLAYHDALTGLANRRSFYSHLKKIIDQTQNSQKTIAILFVDLDGFKKINDFYGHEVGDWLLTNVAQRLQRCIKTRDVVARFGGDEFTIILNHPKNNEGIQKVIARILFNLTQPYIYEGMSLSLGASIGISQFPYDALTHEKLVSCADKAMYFAKQSGTNKACFYKDLNITGIKILPSN